MKLAGFALVVGLVSISPRADASCGTPLWLGTPTGASIPSKGSLYLYDEALAVREASERIGGPIVGRTKISDQVLRLDYVTKADELELADMHEPTILNVNPKWKPPAAAPRVVQYWRHQRSWTCSYADALMLQIDQPTAAFRVFWRFRDRPTREFIIPARTAANNVNVLELGKIDCGRASIDPDELAAGGILSLIAIRYDGSEVAVANLPPTISTVDMPSSEDGVSRAVGYPLGTEPTTPLDLLMPAVDHDWPFHLFLLLLVPAALLTFVALRDRAVREVV